MAEVLVRPGLRALVDDADLPLVSGYAWRVHRTRWNVYAVAYTGGETYVLMHRLLTGAKRGHPVDHANHNGLDNRRENLRVCTPQQNCFNRRVSAKSKTGLKGVVKHQNRYRAQATLNREIHRIGTFATPDEAHAAYVAFIKKHHGTFACEN